ncbi:nitronate monooxygenase [Nocardioides astragali]|uniref:Nitronate monooxygenase n=1 Tax=Nocardioides astragali TaxID=1776736 RepID=A0ABW2MZS5_9ACTN|nr:nitronate monooxygenase [Nocardioides astragali]
MKTAAVAALGADLPIFAFSHCRDVIAAVTKAGGVGVLGAAWMTPEELEMSIEWIENEVGDKPFGVDLVFPGTSIDVEKSPDEYLAAIPEDYMSFVSGMLDQAGVADLSEQDRRDFMIENAQKMAMTNKKSRDQLDVSLGRSSVKLIVGALGVTPSYVVNEAHAKGVQVGALVGSGRHAAKQRDAGVDLLVAQGTEAGGSVGSVASMVLWPQVVEAARGVPVLAAGGVSRGSHLLAALSLGCQGVWLGSLWLGTVEGELSEEMRERLYRAESEDAVIARVMTGKQGRMLSTEYVKNWNAPDAPAPLTWPMQSILNGYSYKRAERGRNLDYWTYAVGQVVGDMKGTTTVRREIERMLNEYGDALESLMEVAEAE